MQLSNDLIQNASRTLPKTMYITYTPQGILPNLVSKSQSINGGNLFGIEATRQVC